MPGLVDPGKSPEQAELLVLTTSRAETTASDRGATSLGSPQCSLAGNQPRAGSVFFNIHCFCGARWKSSGAEPCQLGFLPGKGLTLLNSHTLSLEK